MTRAERCMWQRLRAGRLDGWKFRRQVPLGGFVVDFLCERARLIIEIDGGQHAEESSADAKRTTWLLAQGYDVVRYWNNDIFGNLDGVLEHLLDALETRCAADTPR